MCGITGFLGTIDDAVLKRMTDSIVHRGPNSEGSWSDFNQRISLGHRRLSILDLSSAGHQPMQTISGRYVITFNGEIYNHLELRKELEKKSFAISWRGHSDTETLLAGFEAWGIQKTLEKCVGMFAFGVWDKETANLTLGRDRLGEKPLYYGWQGQGDKKVFLFGSELKALRAHPSFENKIDRGALSLELRHNCIPAPYSIYQGISKLLPGHLLSVSLKENECKTWPYWNGSQAAKYGVDNSFKGTDHEAIDQLENLLKESIKAQMMADVPLGAFLSGGIDSSTIVALMQVQSSRPIKTFTIGFHEKNYNEAIHAKAVAKHLGTDHTEMYVSPEQAMAVIPRLPTFYDEPFSDASQIPTFLVSELAKKHVTVSLSGDAGDELFAGYNRYAMSAKLWNKLDRTPLLIRKLAASGLTSVSPQVWNHLMARIGKVVPRSAQMTNIGEKLHKGAGVLASQSIDDLYYSLASHWNDPAKVVIGGFEPSTLLTGNKPSLYGLNSIERMMALDMLTYLPDDILTKVDRAAMAVSLETRVPFLDHRVVEFAWKLPQSMKLRDGQTKWALRQVLYRHVPKELIERPKMGFGVPIDTWLRGPLRDWAEALLDETRLKNEGFFHPASIRMKWKEHLSGQRNWQYHLWDILMFQAWREVQ